MKKIWESVKRFFYSRGWQEIEETGGLHFFGCFAFVVFGHHFGMNAFLAVGIALGLGFVKEFVDLFRGRGFDWYDIGMNFLGTFIGLVFVWPKPW